MTSAEQLELVIRMAVGSIGGLAVGIEREWSGRAEGERPRFAGVRTFLLIGLLGTLSALFIELGLIVAGATILVGSTLLIVIAYASTAYRGDRESTTEFAALIVLGAGALAGTGHLAIASGMNVFLALVLMEKSRIHSFVYRIQSEDLAAGFRFGVLALVVLPLLPKGPFGPAPGIYPRELWALVLLFSGLSFAGFIARRTIGARKGYILAGLLGGIVSSTLVTLNFSRESRTEPESGRSLASGVIAACTVLPVRTAFLLMILNPRIGTAVMPHLLITFATGLLIIILFRKEEESESKWNPPKSPLRLFSAIQMVIAFQIALTAFYWIQNAFGATGVLISSAIAGLTDVDTLTFMIGKQKSLAINLAVQSVVIGVTANTILKMILALSIGTGLFRVAASLGLLALSVVLVISLILLG
jgi:uncharacterized membrane protein (DUF4010 family)